MAFKNWTLSSTPYKSLNDGSSDYWTLSGSGTSEYYYNQTDLKHKPLVVYEGSTKLTEGTLGSLAAGEWAWGDNDSIGGNRLYVRTSGSVDPDTLASGTMKCSDALTVVTAGATTTPLLFAREITNNDTTNDATVKLILTDSSDVVKHETTPFTVTTTQQQVVFDHKVVLNSSQKYKIMSDIEDVSILVSGME